MVFGIALIFLVQWAFLGNLRSALIVGATIPFALFFAVGILVLRGESANFSVGAIDFGLIVDGTVIPVSLMCSTSASTRFVSGRKIPFPGNGNRQGQRLVRMWRCYEGRPSIWC